MEDFNVRDVQAALARREFSNNLDLTFDRVQAVLRQNFGKVGDFPGRPETLGPLGQSFPQPVTDELAGFEVLRAMQELSRRRSMQVETMSQSAGIKVGRLVLVAQYPVWRAWKTIRPRCTSLRVQPRPFCKLDRSVAPQEGGWRPADGSACPLKSRKTPYWQAGWWNSCWWTLRLPSGSTLHLINKLVLSRTMRRSSHNCSLLFCIELLYHVSGEVSDSSKG